MLVFLKAGNNAEPKKTWKEFWSSINSVAVLFWKRSPNSCVVALNANLFKEHLVHLSSIYYSI